MYSLRRHSFSSARRATYFLGSGSTQKNLPVLTSDLKGGQLHESIRSREDLMSFRNRIALLLALSTLLLLVACGSNGNVNPTPPPSGSFSNADLSGTYVFSVNGTDSNGATYAIVGTFIANGKGGNNSITGGTIDINDAEFQFLTPTPVAPISNSPLHTNGYYSVNVDGRGQATLGTDTPFGNITLDFVLSSSSHGLVTEFDSNGSGSGTLDLQAAGVAQSSLAGSYALSFSGIDGALDAPFASVGAFTIDLNGNILSGSGEDFNDGDVPYANQSLSGSVILGPASPALTFLETESFALTYDVYAIDSTHLKFIEMDSSPILAGDAFLQPSAAITSGPAAFTASGFLPFTIEGATPFAAGGFMTFDGEGGITGSEDENNGGLFAGSIPFSASYTNVGVAPSRFLLNNFDGFVGGTSYAAYPSSGGLLMLQIDGSGILTGAAYPQSSTAFASSQGYGLNLTGINFADDVEVDDIAEFTATSGALTGIIDENFAPAGVTTSGLALIGTYGAVDSTGRYALSAAAGNSSTTTLNGGFSLNYYGVDGTTFPFIETDSGQVATGVIVLQTPSDPPSGAVRKPMFVPTPLVRPHAKKRPQK